MSYADKIKRLQRLATTAAHYREQMEGLAAECCQVMGVDPESETVERDWFDEIVFHGTDPADVYSRLKKLNRHLKR